MRKGLSDMGKEDDDAGFRVLPLAVGTNDASSNATAIIVESRSKGMRRRDRTAAAATADAAVAALDAMVDVPLPPLSRSLMSSWVDAFLGQKEKARSRSGQETTAVALTAEDL